MGCRFTIGYLDSEAKVLKDELHKALKGMPFKSFKASKFTGAQGCQIKDDLKTMGMN